jgi:hypothetical protein
VSGTQTNYCAKNADVVLRYANHPQCIVRLWFPDGYAALEDMPVFIVLPGGGWDQPHVDTYASIHQPETALLGGGATSIYDAMLNAGWVIGRAEYPHGIHVDGESRVHPTSRWPEIPRYIGRCIQFLKTHALNGRITGSRASTLATHYSRYILAGDSAGGIEALYVAHQPDRWLPYDDRLVSAGGFDPFVYRYNHRVRGVYVTDAGCDFTKWASNAVSASALTRFGARENFFVNPAYGMIEPEQKRVSSPLPLVEANYAENRNVGIWQEMNEGSITDGQTNPTTGASGSYLGSGTVVTTTAITGTFQVGETVTGSVTGTGTFKGSNTDGSTKYLYIERGSTAVFSGTLTGGTSGATCTVGGCEGNNNRLAFLDYDEALEIWDEAGETGEIADCRAVHEQIHGAALKRACDTNDSYNGITSSLHRHWIGNDYVAGISGTGHTAAFTWNGLSHATEYMSWVQDTLGITTD